MTPLTAIAPADLPSLPLDERKGLPVSSAIYVVMAGDTVLNIGVEGMDDNHVARVDNAGREQARGYRPLKPGERAIRRTCPHCGDTHLALLDPSTGAAECRACGAAFFVNTIPRGERHT